VSQTAVGVKTPGGGGDAVGGEDGFAAEAGDV